MGVKTEYITIEDLLSKVAKYDDNKDDLVLIRNAYDYAYRKHFSQKRITGDDYITHPLNIAYILTDIHADAATICAGLLHDVLEEEEITKEDLEEKFGSEVASLVDGVNTINKLSFNGESKSIQENNRKV